jgi:hypothetical protein
MVDPIRDAAPGPSGRSLLTIGAAGLLAGLLSFGLGELAYECFLPEEVPQPLGGGMAMRPTRETVARADSRNSALTFGAMGGVLGLILGLVGGLTRRSIGSAARAGLVGLVLGATLGAVLPLLLIEPFHRLQARRNSDDLFVPIGLHAAIWGPLGAVAGLAFGIGRGRPGMILRCMIGGLVGAVFGTMVYDATGAAVSPLAGTSDAISKTWATRLLARLLVPIGAAAGIALSGPAPEPPEPEAAASRPDPAPAGGP